MMLLLRTGEHTKASTHQTWPNMPCKMGWSSFLLWTLLSCGVLHRMTEACFENWQGESCTEDGILETSPENQKCPINFLGLCKCGKSCYQHRILYVTNCTGQRFEDVSVLSQIPQETEVLLFTGNEIPQLPGNVIGRDDYPYLKIIDFSGNHIQGIRGKTFHHVSTVCRLFLDHNDINIADSEHPRVFSNFESLQELHLTNAFTESVDAKTYMHNLQDIFSADGSNMVKLRKLHLEQNEIDSFPDPNIFCELPALEELYLANNDLFDIHLNFTCMKNLRYIGLQYNKIHSLAKSTLQHLDQLARERPSFTLDLTGNPFVCDCHISNFLNWMQHTNMTLLHKETYKCQEGIPETNKGLPLTEVESYYCCVNTKKVDPATHTIIAWTIVLLITAFLCVMGYMNRDLLRKHGASLWQRISYKGAYTSIVSRHDVDSEEVHL